MFFVVDIVNVTEFEIYFEKDSSLQNHFSVFYFLFASLRSSNRRCGEDLGATTGLI